MFVVFPVMSGIKPKDTVLHFSIKRAIRNWCFITYMFRKGRLPRWLSGVKNLPDNAGKIKDTSLIPGWQRSSLRGGGHDNPLQYSCLENPMDRGAWWATVSGVEELHTTEVT